MNRHLLCGLLTSTTLAWISQATILIPPAPDGKIPRDVGGLPGVAPALDWDTTQGVVLGTGGRGQPASVPQFNPALGTLTKATLRIYQFDTQGTMELQTLSSPSQVHFEEFVTFTLYPATDYPTTDGGGYHPGTPLLSKANTVLTIGTLANPVDLAPNSALSFTANYSLSTPCDLVYTGTDLSAFIGTGTLEYVVGTLSEVAGYFPDVFGASYVATGRFGMLVIYEYTGACTPAGTATIGYWKNHPEAWPVPQVKLGCITYSKANAIANILGASGSDASLLLAKQLLAAKLSADPTLCNTTTCVDIDIVRADQLLCQYPPGSGAKGATRTEILAIKSKLDDYNNGRLCEQHRD